ncbi:MAG: 2-dehydropantoate 2-reductase N-terminal domain-containing protein, partial [Chloroflexota bacterium]
MITIVGVGAMASLFAARLGEHVPARMLGSWVDAVSAINAAGIRLETATGEKVIRVSATTVSEECGGSQFALVLVKSWQTGRAAQQIKSLLAPDGVALTLQNGIGNLETLSAELGPDRAALGVTTQGATLIGPGHAREGGRGAIHIGAHPRIQPLVDLLVAADFDTHVAPDVTSLAWG